MSYDLILVALEPGEGVDALMARLEDEADAPLPDPDLKEVIVAIAADLAGDGYEFVEGPRFVNIINDAFGTVCDVRANGADIKVAYWHRGDRATEVMDSVIGLVDRIQEATGWTLYDPQSGEIVSDLAALTASSAREMDRTATWASSNLPGSGAAAERATKRPWWRFWG